MKSRRFGCLTTVALLIAGYAISLGLVVAADRYFTGSMSFDFKTMWAAALPAVLFVSVLMEIAMRIHIRRQCAKWGLKVTRIQTRKTNYKVTYFVNGRESTGKWPDDFKSYTDTDDESHLRHP